MWAKNKHRQGFTIVELLIVIVVIGILAAITIVAYNGIQTRARTAAVTSQLTQASQKIAVWQADNPGQSPVTLADVGVADTDSVSYQLTSNNSVSPSTFCVTATYGSITYYIDNTGNAPTAGVCSGYNLVAWNKTKAGAPVPVVGVVVDSTVFHTSTASMRIGPGGVGKLLQANPFGGTPGQIYTVSLWIKTDATWDGTAGNSKIRFGDASTNALLTACGYNGAKATWTQVTCSWTLTAGSPQVAISVGNDGTVGNIWIDDLSVVRSN